MLVKWESDGVDVKKTRRAENARASAPLGRVQVHASGSRGPVAGVASSTGHRTTY